VLAFFWLIQPGAVKCESLALDIPRGRAPDVCCRKRAFLSKLTTRSSRATRVAGAGRDDFPTVAELVENPGVRGVIA
jgi:hypothetical protein